jgi:hypothetical protein
VRNFPHERAELKILRDDFSLSGFARKILEFFAAAIERSENLSQLVERNSGRFIFFLST